MSNEVSDEVSVPAEPGLRANRDFLTLWGSETVSQIGAQISLLAVPLTAIGLLHADAGDIGILSACSMAPILVVSPIAGVFVDRLPIKPLMISANLLRMLLLLVIPVAYAVDLLSLPLLWLVALLVGSLTALFDVAYIVALPSLVRSDQLPEANAKLETTYSMAEVCGPGLGGVLVHALGAPFAMLVNALTYLVSGLGIATMSAGERLVAKPESPASFWHSLKRGFTLNLSDRVLRTLVIQSGAFNLFQWCVFTLYPLLAVRTLHIPASLVGVLLSLGAIGGLIGSWASSRMLASVGPSRTIMIGMLAGSAGLLPIAAATDNRAFSLAVIVAGLMIHSAGVVIYNVPSLTLRLKRMAGSELGSGTAAYRVLSNGTLPLGGLLAGFLGTTLGVRSGILVAAIGATLSALALWVSPVRTLRELA